MISGSRMNRILANQGHVILKAAVGMWQPVMRCAQESHIEAWAASTHIGEQSIGSRVASDLFGNRQDVV